MLLKLVEGQFWVSIRLSLRLSLGKNEEIHEKTNWERTDKASKTAQDSEGECRTNVTEMMRYRARKRAWELTERGHLVSHWENPKERVTQRRIHGLTFRERGGIQKAQGSQEECRGAFTRGP